MYDYLLGGTDNFAVDREAVERASAAVGGIDNARADVRANRAFVGQAVRCLAGDAGIRQFLDIGTGIPNPDNVHGVAQATAPEARIVYVDNDPVVAPSLTRSVHAGRVGPRTAPANMCGEVGDAEPSMRGGNTPRRSRAPIS